MRKRCARQSRRVTGIGEIAVAATEWPVKGRDAEWHARQFVIAAREAVFRSDELKSKKDDVNGPAKAVLMVPARGAGAERGVRQGTAIANGMELTKRLGNLPPNICNPSFLADQARKLAKEWKLDVEVLDTKELESLKMGSFLGVARGSAQPPRLIVLKHRGGSAKLRRSCWSARASRSIRGAFRSSPARRWTR